MPSVFCFLSWLSLISDPCNIFTWEVWYKDKCLHTQIKVTSRISVWHLKAMLILPILKIILMVKTFSIQWTTYTFPLSSDIRKNPGLWWCRTYTGKRSFYTYFFHFPQYLLAVTVRKEQWGNMGLCSLLWAIMAILILWIFFHH